MISLTLAFLVSCPVPLVVLEDGLTFNRNDAKVIESVKKGCRKYYGKSSCLRKLIKKSNTNFYAICFTPS